jgi:hypothetical protein
MEPKKKRHWQTSTFDEVWRGFHAQNIDWCSLNFEVVTYLGFFRRGRSGSYSRVNLCGTCGGQYDTVTCFSLSGSLHCCSTHTTSFITLHVTVRNLHTKLQSFLVFTLFPTDSACPAIRNKIIDFTPSNTMSDKSVTHSKTIFDQSAFLSLLSY